MDVQLILVGLVLILAAGYLARHTWHIWTAKGNCGGCKCGGKPIETPIPLQQLTLRRRDKA
jgi:hypothetical protein